MLALPSLTRDDSLTLDRFSVTDSAACQQPGGPCQQALVSSSRVLPGQVPGTASSVSNALIEADLDTVPGAFPPRRSLEPGVAIAGLGVVGQTCGPLDFCIAWKRPTDDADHVFTGFELSISHHIQAFEVRHARDQGPRT